MSISSFKSTYHGKKVLVTGNTGFKGSWLTAWLLHMGAHVYGLSNGIPTNPSHFEVAHLRDHIQYLQVDICDAVQVENAILEIKPDFVFHLAAQPLVRLSYQEPLLTLHTNMMGTAHILEGLRKLNSLCYAVMITSDKCYDNVEWTWGYRETDPVGGKDPYSASKGGAELVIRTYAKSYFAQKDSCVKIVVGRAGNVIGGGDWALDRVVPDSMVAWACGENVSIRKPQATRPWQHVLEPLSGYLVLGEKLFENPDLNGEAFNLGPHANQNHTVKELIEEMQKHWSNVHWTDVSNETKPIYEAGLLKLCCDKALHYLDWQPTLKFDETAKLTVEWYRQYYEHPTQNMLPFTMAQISQYIALAHSRGISWAI
ncbi:MAG: CDP-glucose 4,6-dehydratase [SAR324 cluster bacterium]|nr:CDP-glucose 4,6-dehydratase [SAR324 cluster bacterium]MBF0351740.1 CDP-glucose 4,6-dehydratase [SAR324 cluster bacterium]